MISYLTLVWAGIILGVSFLATPIKFKAKSLTLPVALDVGRATFHFLLKVEWVLALGALITMIVNASSIELGVFVLMGAVLVLLCLQQFHLIPYLDKRVARIINGEKLEKSPMHKIYAVIEVIKVLCLITAGVLN